MINKIDKKLHSITLSLTAGLLLFAVFLTFYQVVTRFVFNAPAPWSEILARGVIIWSVFLGLPYVIRHGELISIEFIYKVFPKNKYAITSVIQFIILIVLAVITYYGIQVSLKVSHQLVALLNFSMSWLYISIPIGCGLSIISILLRQINIIKEVKE
ncbi:TRAP transporter small permease [Vibrio breoganii]